ncbi:unnamed protein product [Caenorhabditis brenneri]
MTETPELTIYEKAFAKSDKTDAILLVDGKKMHVNKTLLSYHSDYFNTLFNSDFKEKSMKEIEIKDVNFENFAIVLSLVHGAPIKYKNEQKQVESLLEIADRFQLSAAKRHIELFLITTTHSSSTLITIADKFQLKELMDITVSTYGKNDYITGSWTVIGGRSTVVYEPKLDFFEKVTDETNNKLFHRWLELNGRITQTPKTENPKISIYESTFAKSDKTDAILVVEGKKLHVNKTILSHHSDYFAALFHSDFKEKSMEEIEIKDVNFENFASLLSLIHLNPIVPTVKNAVNILELSDRFIIPSVRYDLEPFIIASELTSLEKIRIGEKCELSKLFQDGFNLLKADDFTDLPTNPTYQELSFATKRKLFEKSFKFFNR